MVTVPTVNNRQICKPATDLTATDLPRVFVDEFTEPGQSKITALAVCDQLHLLPGESWTSAAHRTLMHTRAAHIQYYINLTLWKRHTTGELSQATNSRTIVRGSLAFLAPQTEIHSTPSSLTFALLFGKTSTGRRSMKVNFSQIT